MGLLAKENVEYMYYIVSTCGFIISLVMLFVAFMQLKKIRLQQNFSSLRKVYGEMAKLRKRWNKVYVQFAKNPNCMTWSKKEKRMQIFYAWDWNV